MAQHNDLGKRGEQLAIDFLTKKGYEILDKNWRFQKAEIDIIAKKDNILAVVEVKTRSTDYFGDPQNFVSQKKIKLLVSAINEYVISKNLEIEVRFDIISVLKEESLFKIEHLKEAFLYF